MHRTCLEHVDTTSRPFAIFAGHRLAEERKILHVPRVAVLIIIIGVIVP